MKFVIKNAQIYRNKNCIQIFARWAYSIHGPAFRYRRRKNGIEIPAVINYENFHFADVSNGDSTVFWKLFKPSNPVGRVLVPNKKQPVKTSIRVVRRNSTEVVAFAWPTWVFRPRERQTDPRNNGRHYDFHASSGFGVVKSKMGPPAPQAAAASPSAESL